MYASLRTAAALVCLVPSAVAFRPAPGSATAMTLEKGSRIWIAGTSTMRSFTCEAPEFTAAIEAAGSGAVDALLAGQKALQTATVTIAAPKMDCGNGTMNDHMRKALKSSAFPTIAFVLGGYEPAKSGAGIAGTIEGQLTLAGVTKPITVSASAKREGETLRVTGAYDVDMKAYGIKPPSLMMGTMKVGRVAKVHFDLFIKG
jgi:polyisoprenoid-binding protein YceI